MHCPHNLFPQVGHNELERQALADAELSCQDPAICERTRGRPAMTYPKRFVRTPRIPGRIANSPPSCGFACRWSALIVKRAEVTNSVSRFSPPKAQLVGQLQGSSTDPVQRAVGRDADEAAAAGDAAVPDVAVGVHAGPVGQRRAQSRRTTAAGRRGADAARSRR